MLQFIYIWIDNKNNFTVCHKWKTPPNHSSDWGSEALFMAAKWFDTKKLHILSYYITQKFDAT